MPEANGQFDYAEAIVMEYARTRQPHLRDKIVEEYREFVNRIARRYSGFEMHEDLAQVGFTGLLNALGMFEPAKGVRFNTYATHLVAGAIKHYLRDRSKVIREPAWLQEVRHRVNRAAAQIQQENGQGPSPEQIAERTNVPVETVKEVLMTDDLFRVASISGGSASEEDDTEAYDVAGDDQEQLSIEDRLVLENAFSELRELERSVLYLFHFESLSQTEIATKLSISSNYVSHILRHSLTKLRQRLTDDERKDRAIRRQMNSLPDEVMDDVTGVYSEHHTRSLLSESCSRAACEGSTVGYVEVVFLGIDRFGAFYGQDAVEGFLADAARYLKEAVRRLDIVGRMGSYGFGIILPGTGETVSVVVDRISNRLRGWIRQSNLRSSGVTVMVGESYYPKCGRNAASLIKAIKHRKIDSDLAA